MSQAQSSELFVVFEIITSLNFLDNYRNAVGSAALILQISHLIDFSIVFIHNRFQMA